MLREYCDTKKLMLKSEPAEKCEQRFILQNNNPTCELVTLNSDQWTIFNGVLSTITPVLGYMSSFRGLTGGFLLLWIFSVAISVSPNVCFILVLILVSMFQR